MTFTEFWEVMTPAQGFVLAMVTMMVLMVVLMFVMLVVSKLTWGSWLP